MTNEGSTAHWQLSLVMPAYNEETAIDLAVAEAHEALAGLDLEYEIIVVDDGSGDATARRVRDLAALIPTVRLAHHERNRGYGAALRTGFAAAQYPLVAFTDADGQFFLDDLERLLPLTARYPIVAGRRLKRQDPLSRRFFSWGYNRLVRLLLGTRVHDCDCALKVFRRDALIFMYPESDGFFVNAEMLCRANRLGLDVAEVGVRHRPRRHGSSKVSLREIPRTLGKLLPYWWTHVVRSPRPEPLRLPAFALAMGGRPQREIDGIHQLHA
jgi:glycosyltransferase involved in cell wall biosynthesis